MITAMQWREAVKFFDKDRVIPDGQLDAILEAGRLSPSSYGIEPWKFLVIRDGEIRKRIREVAYDQPRVTDSSVLIVIARRAGARHDLAPELVSRTARARGVSEEAAAQVGADVQMKIDSLDEGDLDCWVRSQVYIPLGVMMSAASLIRIDCAAMEGFLPERVDEVLGLPAKGLKSTVMLSLGYRAPENEHRPKARRDFLEVVEYIG